MSNIFKPSRQLFGVRQSRGRNQDHQRYSSFSNNSLLDFSIELDRMLGRKKQSNSQAKSPFRITKRIQDKFPKQKSNFHKRKHRNLDYQTIIPEENIRPVQKEYNQRKLSIANQASRKMLTEISQLKTKLEIQKAVNQKQIQLKIQNLLNRYNTHEIERSHHSPQNRSSLYISPQPLPIIFPPYYHQPHNYHNYHTNQYDSIQRPGQQMNSRYQTFKSEKRPNYYYKNKKQAKRISPIINQKNKKRLRKCFIAVYFTICLRKLMKNIVRSRRLMFENFWPEKFQVHMQNLRQIFKFYTKSFFQNVMKLQSSLNFVTEQIQLRQKSVSKKRQLIKQLVTKLFDQLSLLVEDSKSIQKIYVKNERKTKLNFLNIIHIFCKHGAFIKDQLMTQFQLNDSCVSEMNGYLRMDKHLQKAQIVNFIFLKLLLFNMILQPIKVAKAQIEKHQDPKIVTSNFHLLGSIVYHIFMELRGRYIQNVPIENYSLGNWKKYKKKFNYVACSPLILKEAANTDGRYSVLKKQMITGVLNSQKARAIYGDWGKQVKFCSNMVKNIHQQLVQYHLRLVEQIM